MAVYLEKRKKVILFATFALAVFLILFHFTDTPKVWVDEGVFTETAKNIAQHGVIGLQTSQGVFFSMRNLLLTTSYPVIFPVVLSFKLFSTGLWQARLPMVIYMFLLVVVFYFFTIKLYGKKYGFYPSLASILLLISFAPFYGDGRPVLGEVPALFFLVLGSLSLLYLEEDNFQSKKLAVLSGLAFGLSASVKPIFFGRSSFSYHHHSLFLVRENTKQKSLSVFRIRFFIACFTLVLYPYSNNRFNSKSCFNVYSSCQ